MSRTTLYKGIYFGIVGVGTLALLGAILFFRLSLASILIVVALLLVPGRVLAYFWRDLLRGLRLLNEKNFLESKRHSELFLVEVRQKPWLKKLIWLGSGSYSRDPESLALNDLGAAEINLGEFEAARSHLEASIAVDNKNALPYFNLGALARIEGNESESIAFVNQAAQLHTRIVGLPGYGIAGPICEDRRSRAD